MFGCEPSQFPPFVARLAGPEDPASPDDRLPVLEPVPFFDLFLSHAFLDTTCPIRLSDLDAARALVELTGDPHAGLAVLDEQELIGLPPPHLPYGQQT